MPDVHQRERTGGASVDEAAALVRWRARPAAGGMSTDPSAGDVSQEPALWLTVADDGVGFEGTASRPGHFGLVGMRERAARVGAALTLVTASGEGTEIVVVWPGAGASA